MFLKSSGNKSNENSMASLFACDAVTEFSEQEVSRKIIKAVVKDAMNAPSAGNQCPWEFYFVTDPETKEKLANCARVASPAALAPVVIVLCYQKRTKHPAYTMQDMATCANNMMLSANSYGLGAYWAGIAPKEYRMDQVSNVLTLPRHLQPFSIMCLGYPASGEIPKKQNRFDPAKLHFTVNVDDFF